MADWFTGKATHCSDANGGTTWADAKLTITSLLTVGYAAGDRLLAGPGVYREQVTLNGSGQATFNAGTVSVTNESTIVTGAGFVAGGVVAGDQLFIGNFATAADGIGSGGAAFTTAASNPFQANMVGYMIEIIGQGAYVIATYVGPGSITLTDVGGLAGWPAAVGGLTFYVVSGEGPYEIESVLAAQLTLVKPWSGPSLVGLSYQIFLPVYLIADTTGVETDGVGGIVRVSASDNDETWTRDYCFYADTKDYWIIRGFHATGSDYVHFYFGTCTYITVEDCVTIEAEWYSIETEDCTQITLRRDIILGCGGAITGTGIYGTAAPDIDNTQILFENLYIDQHWPVVFSDSGGHTIKNVNNGFRSWAGIDAGSAVVGASAFVHDCNIHFCVQGDGLSGSLIEQYNNLWQNTRDRHPAVGVAANSTQYPYLPALPLLGDGVRWPIVTFFAPSEWDATRDAGGLYPKNEDLFGVHNEVAQTRRSWGAMHQYPTKRDTTVAYGAFVAAQEEDDSMEQQHYYNVQEARTYTITVQVYLDANYTGNNPQMTVSQPGQADVIATSTGAKGSWEQLTATFTTGAALDWIAIFLKSRNTSALANRSVRWQDLDVR